MNDPHVVALVYRLEHDRNVTYVNAEPLVFETDDFSARVDDGRARFEMKEHFASAEEARAVVEPFIQRWELSADLECGPNQFALRYEKPEIDDRKPTPGVHELLIHETVKLGVTATALVNRGKYPEPAMDIALDANVEAMRSRYNRYREGRELLAPMAYFCLTVLEDAGAEQAPKRYGVSRNVLSKLRELSSSGGGEEARKAKGRGKAFTPQEREWVASAVNRLIRRAAEVARDPDRQWPKITMEDLPTL